MSSTIPDTSSTPAEGSVSQPILNERLPADDDSNRTPFVDENNKDGDSAFVEENDDGNQKKGKRRRLFGWSSRKLNFLMALKKGSVSIVRRN